MADSNDAGFVGSIPEHYDRGLGPMIFVDYADDLARRVAALRPARVLETAAGTGILTRRLRDALPSNTRLTSTDLNPPMLEIARGKFAHGERVEFRPADATALPFADASFEAVACQFGVMFFPDKQTAYREVLRVLVPGGTYLFNIWDAHRHNPFGRLTHAISERFFPVDPPQFQSVPFAYTFEAARPLLVAAGFTDIKADVVKLEKTIPDAAAFARGLIFGSPLIDQVRVRGGVDPEAMVLALAADLRSEFGADPGRMPLQATVISAVRPA